MKSNILSHTALSIFMFSTLSFAQNELTAPLNVAAHEEVIQIQVTAADYAAVAVHRRVHTNGAVRLEGGHYPPRTFETDSSGALVEVTRNFSSPQSAGQAAPALTSSGAPSFLGPGFYPADLSLVSNSGQTITRTQVHNVYINCTAACFGYPAVFENNLFSSRLIHVLDQYVGSDDNDRYELGPSLAIPNYPIPNTLVTNPVVNYADLDAILHAAASQFGSGYNHIYSIFFPKGVDVCDGYSPPYTSCFSPDKPASWAWCAEHGVDSFSDIPGFEYATIQPYPDVFSVLNGVPSYGCDVGQATITSDTTPTPNGVVVDSVSNSLSHEIFETITDPDTGSEWVAIDSLFGNIGIIEVGDVCEVHNESLIFTPFYISGHLYEIQPEYSNKYHACVTVP